MSGLLVIFLCMYPSLPPLETLLLDGVKWLATAGRYMLTRIASESAASSMFLQVAYNLAVAWSLKYWKFSGHCYAFYSKDGVGMQFARV